MTDFVTVKEAQSAPSTDHVSPVRDAKPQGRTGSATLPTGVSLKAGASYVQTDNGVMKIVAQTYNGCDTNRYEARDYAQLFAAAPKMYEALKQIAAEPTRGELMTSIIDGYRSLAQAAIAKAEAR